MPSLLLWHPKTQHDIVGAFPNFKYKNFVSRSSAHINNPFKYKRTIIDEWWTEAVT